MRIRRICEKEKDYVRHRQELKLQLRRRGYSGKLIEAQLQKVDKLDRNELLEVKRQDKSARRVPLVVTFSNLLPDMHRVVRKHMNVLYRSERMKEVYKEPPIVAFRRDRNICDTLVHSKTNKALKPTSQTCQDGCEKCQQIVRDQIRDTSGNISYTPVRDATCRARNVVYAIICSRCDCTVYVGETERELRERMTEHLRDVRLRKEKPINSHFEGVAHGPVDLTFAVLEKVFGAERIERQLREAIWIRRLSTARPDGCNVKEIHFPAL